MINKRHKQQVHQLGHNEHADTDLHRRPDILFCVKTGRQDAHEDETNQTDAICDYCVGGHSDIVLPKFFHNERAQPSSASQWSAAAQRLEAPE